MLNILLLGSTGQLGTALLQPLQQLGDVHAVSHTQLDVADTAALRQMLDTVQPDWIVNAAAYTAVDRAEHDVARAYAVNAQAVAVLADYAQQHGAWLLHYSTDYVFDGSKPMPYVETDTVNPLSVYGASKQAGEQAIVASGCKHFIVRTGWLCSAAGEHFARTILRLARQREKLSVVDDQMGAPTSAAWLAQASVQAMCVVLQQTSASLQSEHALSGVYHLSAAGQTSWHGYAQFVLRAAQQAGLPLRVLADQVHAVSSDEYANTAHAAPRPANACLDNHKACTTFAIQQTSWQAQVTTLLPAWFTQARDD